MVTVIFKLMTVRKEISETVTNAENNGTALILRICGIDVCGVTSFLLPGGCEAEDRPAARLSLVLWLRLRAADFSRLVSCSDSRNVHSRAVADCLQEVSRHHTHTHTHAPSVLLCETDPTSRFLHRPELVPRPRADRDPSDLLNASQLGSSCPRFRLAVVPEMSF